MSKITNRFLAQMAANTVKGNSTGSTANPQDISLVSTATASAVMIRDTNVNVAINNINEGFATTATAAGTTTLTASSAPLQQFTGTSTQTVVLPAGNTVPAGCQIFIFNRSTGTLTVEDSSTATIQTMATGSQCMFTLATTGTPGTWDLSYTISANGALPASALPATIQSTISSTSIDWSLTAKIGGIYTKTLSANTTFTFANAVAGQTIIVALTNTASNYTVTWPTCRWAGGTAPTMSTGAVSDIYTFVYDGSHYYGSFVQNMS